MNMFRKPTTNKSAISIKQDHHAPEHICNSPSPHPPPILVETSEVTPSSTCSVLKVPPDSFILHITPKLPAHYLILRGRMAAGRTPEGSLAHGGTILAGSIPLSSQRMHPNLVWSVTTHLKSIGAVFLHLETVLCFNLFISRCCKAKTKPKDTRQECSFCSMRLLFPLIPPKEILSSLSSRDSGCLSYIKT